MTSHVFQELENKYSQKNITNLGFSELLSLQLCLLHQDFVRIAGAEIFVERNLSLERYDVPDVDLLGGRDCQIEAAGIARAVLEVDPVPVHYRSIDLRDLPLNQHGLVGVGISIGKQLADGYAAGGRLD